MRKSYSSRPKAEFLKRDAQRTDRQTRNFLLFCECVIRFLYYFTVGILKLAFKSLTEFLKLIYNSVKNEICYFEVNKCNVSDYKKIRVPIPKYICSLLYERARHYCEVCGMYFNHLHIHHINEDPSDNRVENLLAVCPNCHDEIHNGKD